MISSLTTFAGTVIGKITIGTSLVVAAAGGAHAAGVVDAGSPLQDSPSEVVLAVAAPTPEAGPTPASTPEASPSPESTPEAGETPPGATTSTHTVLDAGSVTIAVNGTTVSVVTAQPATGWTAEIETDEPHEAGVNFRNGVDRVDFRAQIEDGRLRIRIRDRRTDTRTEQFVGPDGQTGVDDDDHSGSDHDTDSDGPDDNDRDDDDRSSHGNGHDDDDRSSHGNGHDDDDRSGHGNGHDDDDDDDEDEDDDDDDEDEDDDDEDEDEDEDDDEDDDDDDDDDD